MGTHPIFESDFDCLTEGWTKMLSRLASRPGMLAKRALSTTSQRKAIDIGLYTVGYRWHAYTDPIMIFSFHVMGIFFWTYFFHCYFYEGDHVATHIGIPNEAVIRPQFQGQINRLYLNSELGLPTVLPDGSIAGAEKE